MSISGANSIATVNNSNRGEEAEGAVLDLSDICVSEAGRSSRHKTPRRKRDIKMMPTGSLKTSVHSSRGSPVRRHLNKFRLREGYEEKVNATIAELEQSKSETRGQYTEMIALLKQRNAEIENEEIMRMT